MSSTLTVSDLLAWISASTNADVVIESTPSSATTELLQRCLDSSVASIEGYCIVPDTYPVEVEQAVLMLASRLWARRATPNGIALGDFGTVRVGNFDADVEVLLAPWRRWSFGNHTP